MRYTLVLFTCLQKPLICETSTDLLVSETSAHNEFYTHALAILRACARVLAHRTRTEYTVRVLAHYALCSRTRNLASMHHACEWQRASTHKLLCNARARTFKTYYKSMAKLRYIAILASLFTDIHQLPTVVTENNFTNPLIQFHHLVHHEDGGEPLPAPITLSTVRTGLYHCLLIRHSSIANCGDRKRFHKFIDTISSLGPP